MSEPIEKLKEINEGGDKGPWRWRNFGPEDMLVSDQGGRNVILCGAKSRDPEHGLLVPIHKDLPNAKRIATFDPILVGVLLELAEGAKCMTYCRDRFRYPKKLEYNEYCKVCKAKHKLRGLVSD